MVTAATPDISFLIPAYNAEDTLAECLASLQQQTRSNWQAVVVDDGSSDRSWEILQGMAETDSRILPVRQPNAGAAAARNHAARLAAAPLLCMLDADDWVDSRYIENMLPAADAALPVIAHCAYRRVAPDGRMMPVAQAPILTGDHARREFSSFCAIAIHTAVFPKSLFERIGGMDETLQTGEEWELWLRMAFAGAEFRRVDPCLAFYRMKAGSLSGDPRKLVRDAVRVTTKAQALRIQQGMSAEGLEAGWVTPAFSQLRMLVWAACARLDPAADVATLAALLPEIPDAAGHERFLVDVVMHGLRTGLLADRDEDLIDALAKWQPTFLSLIRLIERHSFPGTGRKIIETLGWRLTAENPLRSFTLGNLQVISVELGRLARIPKAAQADTLVMHAFSGKEHVGSFVGPFWGDLSIRAQVRLIMQEMQAEEHLQTPRSLAYAGSWTREALRGYRAFGDLIIRSGRRGRLERLLVRIGRDAILTAAPSDKRDNDARLSDLLLDLERRLSPPVRHAAGAEPHTDKPAAAVHSAEEYWEHIFERPDPWNYLSVYEQVKYAQTLSLIPEGTETALELACAEGIFTEKLAPKVGRLTATDISQRAIDRAVERCRGHDNVEFRVLDFARQDLPPEQDLVICSEVLYYMKDEEMLAEVCRKIAAAVKPGGCLITAHPHLRRDEPARTGFDWGHPFGVGTIKQVLASQAGLALEETVDTALYAIHRFRKAAVADPVLRVEPYGTPIDVDVARHIIYGPAGIAREAACTTEVTAQIPILMYHRIAEDGPAALRRFRTPPEIFRKQMQFLRRHGYYAVTTPTLLDLFHSGKPIQGRPVMLTFDDAYLDFRTDAFPILAENDFSAEVFVVTDKVGGRSDWDSAHGEPAGLMSWADILELHKKGISFGSHLASHTPASAIDNDALLAEAMRSRNALQTRLTAAVDSIALPYGATDFRVPGILELAGYGIGFTTRPATATFSDNLFALPRLEVRGDRPLEAFPELIGLPGAFIG
ncbi:MULTISPECIES: trifunctional glycosyltransferase/class I SAM-dependent methyltransferase/polysaccharide deacetylase [Rhizobium]|uniref:trifunctional glycosyltransferase/class I SAM-dependent methyltransferase/polysaccharide deacetylase n=1 Tax=Rhizobium TaxID=379 RepID=UPI00235FFDCB|nr:MULTISPECIES: trifunctional glycosyltransferase/class I SAM-dependent methyltransferase/polysaccharide deacetylase [unclassified Rhizobium]MDC9810824.1 trifunctional glycosyltransferase/class I SAM-dependent methyltransferase/polysaccharide deacetylase [Rhizobium sp. MC62]WEA59031.1 trifunctional glycosyltransferase/class I SAM-dependent methyltransferase/polysaccharide deacetylase [Rhizobium sp. BJ04]